MERLNTSGQSKIFLSGPFISLSDVEYIQMKDIKSCPTPPHSSTIKMQFLYPLLYLLFLDLTPAHQIPYSFRNHKRQKQTRQCRLTSHHPPRSREALSAFLKLDITQDSCGVDLPSPEQPGEPKIPADINKRINPMSGRQLIRYFNGIGKAIVPALSTGHVLEPMAKFVKDMQVNLDFITYKDPEISYYMEPIPSIR
ncbi:hypothetical protein BcDW1_7427 [Botrytis cinerea BcDW1]|uniref:Uncharacterized protein n=1 Tax=Botryotinia fuckeliana (strain BcDW1) TaxID=1290391 RepID=M7TRM1_BOTF1|nr:hypothetical protein BcDW1_7427 [Botrytis cinerea BcDW1]